MQEYHDARMKEIKILADFDLPTEDLMIAMGIEDFYFHVWARKDTKHHG